MRLLPDSHQTAQLTCWPQAGQQARELHFGSSMMNDACDIGQWLSVIHTRQRHSQLVVADNAGWNLVCSAPSHMFKTRSTSPPKSA